MTDNIADVADSHGTQAWFEIHVTDLDRATAFYGKVFGWTFEPLSDSAIGDYLVITTRSGAAAGGGLARTAGRTPPGGASTVVYLQVGDIDAGIESALAAGGSIHRPKGDIGGAHGYFAIVRDPEGNHIGLWSATV
jgi:predicted enzyme related to lactoylglutathione lyase